MDVLFIARIALVAAIAFVYMLFDLFNRRNVPSIFAYATLGFGTVFTIFYLNTTAIIISFAIALVIGALGYLVYRAGQLGAADVIEFAAISLILPVQPAAYLTSTAQFGLPFVISLFIATGVVALFMIPIYYLPRAKRVLKKSLSSYLTRSDLFKSALLTVAYLAFLSLLFFYIGVSWLGILLVLLIMVSSVVTMVFARPITDSMVEYIGIKDFEEGDMIALNLMNGREIRETKKKIKGFDRLITLSVMKEMQKAKIKRKFPVYRHAMPLALPIFIGVIISLLFGNLLLLVI